MRTFTRWRLAAPFIVFSALFLFGAILGARAYWSGWTSPNGSSPCCSASCSPQPGHQHLHRHRPHDPRHPWQRIGIIAVFFALPCGVTLVRRTL